MSDDRKAWADALENGKQNEGLTSARLAVLLGEGKSGVHRKWEGVRGSRLISRLTAATGKPASVVVLDYLRAVAARLPETVEGAEGRQLVVRDIVDLTLALHLRNSQTYDRHLMKRRTDRAPTLLRRHPDAAVHEGTTYKVKIEDPALAIYADALSLDPPIERVI